MLGRARSFLSVNARLLERLRYACLFEKAAPEPMLRALEAYQNPDGGYGNGLEPDLRGPESEPIPVWTALGLLDEIGEARGAVLARILEWLESAEAKEGGIPFVFPAARASPHAPWWETGSGKVVGSLNPTAGIVAYLFRNRTRSGWLDRNAAWCWDRIEEVRRISPYELRVVLAFLDETPERTRAARSLERLRPLIRSSGEIVLDAGRPGDEFRPLDFSPEPNTRSRGLWTPSEIAGHLDRIAAAQRPDGGWSVAFPIWTPLTRFEWEGVQTVEMLKTLRANGRLGSG